MALLPTRDEKVRGRAGFAEITMEDLPSLEILIIDEIAGWIFSPENPGKDYNGEHGGAIVTLVLHAVQGASKFHPESAPEPTEAVTAMRERVFEGVQQIASTPEALSTFVVTLMPAVISELERLADDPASQLYWLYCYALLVLAGGRAGDLDQNLMIGIMGSFDGWNDLMTEGFTLPWRAEVPSEA